MFPQAARHTPIAPPPRAAAAAPRHTPPVPADAVRHGVAQMLTRSQAFNAMPDADRRDIARNTALIADYLARPEGFAGHELPGGLATAPARALDDTDHAAHEADFQTHKQAVDSIGKSKFNAAAAHEGAAVAGELLNQVKFPTFVASLISGVFQSITHSSIEQMKAYQEMIAQVAKSLGQFADEHVTENQARDHMVGQFPDLFEIGMDDSGDTPSPRVQVRDGVDPDEASKTVRARLQMGDGDTFDLSDEASELAVVNRFKMQLAKQRQQMLASIVLMGINRIVVTDGKISAKIIYDVRAQDTLSKQRSATAVDLARDKDGNVQTTYAGKGTYDRGGKYDSSNDKDNGRQYSADYYAKGDYEYENKPIITASTAASETSNSAMQTKIQLSGAVDVNFKSDYLPLDKMATPQMIATITGNATPADPNVLPSPKTPPAAVPAATPAPASAPAAAPAPAKGN
ncbi:hypothetical protein [Burkholderia ambifaria]|jgi:hypothetical protein|uniref:hypothetical protein n=2 Tax=Burkholderia ambifaria TaxID=152480 RepID=UPI00158DE335|nr:hypothetical protein [Burkholderia ambifaria]